MVIPDSIEHSTKSIGPAVLVVSKFEPFVAYFSLDFSIYRLDFLSLQTYPSIIR